MALRDLPYLPLYVQDFLCDEKLANCSAAATGVYIRLMCILHKNETYGTLTLTESDIAKAKRKQNQKQNESKTESKTEAKEKAKQKQIYDFAFKLQKLMPYDTEEIAECLAELSEEGVITITSTTLTQKRMAKSGELSVKRSLAGSNGGRPSKAEKQNESKTESKTKANDKAKQKQNEKQNESKEESKIKANPECARVGTQNSVHIYNQDNNNLDREKEESLESVVRGAGERSENKKAKRAQFTPPTYEEVAEYCRERGNGIDAQLFVDHYAANGWVQGKAGKPLKDWKAAVRTWERNGIVRTGGNNGTATGETRQQAEAAANHRRVDAGEGQPKQRRSTL